MDAETEPSLGLPKSMRFKEEEGMIRDLMKAGLTFTQIVRLSVKFACPKFLTGEVNPLLLENGSGKEAQPTQPEGAAKP